MLDGVTPVPAEFAARYRERGYWSDQPLFEGFTGALARYADRTALVDDDQSVLDLVFHANAERVLGL